MIDQHEIKVVDRGSGYTIGEIKDAKHPTLDYLKEGAIVTLFDGVDTALDFITTNMKEPKHSGSSTSNDDPEFNAFGSYDEAMQTFRHKPEEVVKFDATEMSIKDVAESGTEVDYDLTGDYIDMGRYMEGIPETFGTMHTGNARNRRANIIINLTHSAGVSHHDIKHRGERVLRLIDALEAGGVRCMLTGIESSECNHTEVIIKQHDEPLTISDLAVVTHPEFLRRAIFRIIENSKTWSWGYGSPFLFGKKLTPEVIESGNNNEIDIVLDANLKGIHSIDRVFDQIERLLVWEMSKPIPEVSSIKLDSGGIWFNPNGARSNEEIKREGNEVINE